LRYVKMDFALFIITWEFHTISSLGDKRVTN